MSPGKWSATIVISSLALERFNSKAVVNPMTPAPNTTTSAIDINWVVVIKNAEEKEKSTKIK